MSKQKTTKTKKIKAPASHVITLRCTLAEKQRLKIKAFRARKTLTRYMLDRALNQ